MNGGGDTPRINAKIKIANGETWFVGEIVNSIFRPWTIPDASVKDLLWGVDSSGNIFKSTNQFSGSFATWLENKIKNYGYEIEGSMPKAVELTEGEPFPNLDQYESIS